MEWNLVIGDRLREERQAQGLTLSDVSRATGLSAAFLSRLERGQVSASIANLLEITGQLGLDVRELFDPEADPVGVMVHRPNDSGQVHHLEATGYRWVQVSTGPDMRMKTFLLTFPPRNRMEVMVSHDGEEFCHVLTGEVRFHVGDDNHVLRPGESIHFDSTLPHRAENAGETEATILMVTAAESPHRAQSPPFDWWNVRTDSATG